jgi:hypothetical protein
MTKLPEPAIRQERFHYNSYGEITAQLPDLIGYTEAQMLQFRRDALEEAAKLCENFERNGAWITKLEASVAIRKLGEAL